MVVPLVGLYLILAGAGTALLGPPRAWSPHDTSQSKGMSKGTVEYRTWTSSPRFEKPGTCSYTVFALVTREQSHRLRVDGVEQLVDWSWSWPVDVKLNQHSAVTVEFVDPVTGETLATHNVAEWCQQLRNPASAMESQQPSEGW